MDSQSPLPSSPHAASSSPQKEESPPSIQVNPKDEEGSSPFSGRLPEGVSNQFPIWMKAVSFFLSAVLFLSGFFAVLSPLPLAFLSLSGSWGRRMAWLAALANGAVIVALGGPFTGCLYAIFVLSLALSLPEFLRRRWRIEGAVLGCLGVMTLVLSAILLGYSAWAQLNLVTELRTQISSVLDVFLNSVSPELRTQWLGDTESEEWKRSFLLELPSALAVFSLVMTWMNLVALLRLNPGGIRENLGMDLRYFQRWKAPEVLLWPTIGVGFFVVFEFGIVSAIALNFLKFFLAIYVIQGVSIMSFFLDAWKVRGLLRSLGFVTALLLMMPLVLSLGFFDVWFDFRAKLRQS